MAEREPIVRDEGQSLPLTVLDYGKGIGFFMVIFGVIAYFSPNKSNSSDGPLYSIEVGTIIGVASSVMRHFGSKININLDSW